MYFNAFFRLAVLFLMVFILAVPALAGEPTDQIKETIDKAISILSDPGQVVGPRYVTVILKQKSQKQVLSGLRVPFLTPKSHF
jgi:hypothetical protein